MKKTILLISMLIILGLMVSGCKTTETAKEVVNEESEQQAKEEVEEEPEDKTNIFNIDATALLPERCSFTPGLDCIDFSSTDEKIEFTLENNKGLDVIIDSIISTKRDSGKETVCKLSNAELRKREELVVTCDEKKIDSGRYRYDFEVNYTDSLIGISITNKGTINLNR